MAKLVMCQKLGRELPGLEMQPFAGDLGERIFDQISAQAFEHWQAHARTLISSYRLNLAEQGARDFLRDQMEEFFFGDQAQMPDWFAAGAPSGKSAPPAKGGAPRK